MRRILLGYAEGDSGPDALALGELLARATETGLVLASIYPSDRLMSEEYLLARRREAEERLDEALTRLAPSGIVGHGVTHAAGSAAGGLADLALSERAELLVIGSRHTSPLAKLLSGAVTERLFATSPCPVAIAPRGFAERAPEEFRRIGAGYDGSAPAGAALMEAGRLSRATGAELRILVVCDPTLPPGLDEREREWLAGERRKEADERLEKALVAVDEARHPTGTVVAGVPRDALAAAVASEALELLVIGSRGYGPFHATLAGSVSSHLARHVSCPLVVVPQPQTAAADHDELDRSTSPAHT